MKKHRCHEIFKVWNIRLVFYKAIVNLFELSLFNTVIVGRAVIGLCTSKGGPATPVAGHCEHGPGRGVCASIPDTLRKN